MPACTMPAARQPITKRRSQFSAISPDNATGNFVKIAQRIPVRITVNDGQNNSERLRPGMSVQVTIDTRAEKQP